MQRYIKGGGWEKTNNFPAMVLKYLYPILNRPEIITFAFRMKSIRLIKGEFDSALHLKLAPGIKAGFPSPAEDYLRESLDFNRDLIAHPEATFYGRVDGDSMEDAGINDGDIAVIDRSVEPQHNDVVVGYVNGEFTIKFLDLTHKDEGYIELRPANKRYQPIRINESDTFEVWGVVVWTIKHWKH